MVTIKDVAREAGVSISTVSYALSGKRSIGEKTRQRIAEVITELDYNPHLGAKMLAGERTHLIALSAPLHEDGHLPTHMRFVTEVIRAARRHDYDVVMLATDDEVRGIRRVGSSSIIDGVVSMGVTTDDERLSLLRELKLPGSFIGIPGESADFPYVDLDFAAAARQTVQRLADQGHRSIGLIGHPFGYVHRHSGFIERFDHALRAAASNQGIRIDVRWAGLDRGAGKQAIDELIDNIPDLTAVIFHCNEPVVEEAERRLVERGLNVPEDLSLFAAAASYDLAQLEIPLSGIALPIEQMCAQAVDSVMQCIDQIPVPTSTLLEPQFVNRGSVADHL
ncbi:LacI family DNA-binding transcriptional regulator [Nesterenkonia haasae]|uniref:LacI family DNA-binding transcriptional regulator n=1 Tax=Nesterenkonia haasae TaxID=2587813 RepID=UPI001391D091|nr:LacI family DNA-binding transcriptional regulator [Nesterenkonia haasae]NDK32205.1 LacI family transcriptional regulator [Nesterenkonia haasae]